MCNHKFYYKNLFSQGDTELDTPLVPHSTLETQLFRAKTMCFMYRRQTKWESCKSRYKRQELILLTLASVLPKEKLCNFIIAQINKQIAMLAITVC